MSSSYHTGELTRYLLITLDDVMLKKTNPDSVATAFANSVFPVPVRFVTRVIEEMGL
jgi:hypothetical protein